MPSLKLSIEKVSLKLVAICVLAFPIVFMTVRHGVHLSLFLMLILALIFFYDKSRKVANSDNKKLILLIFFTFASLFIATFISQIFRLNLDLAAFDGPFRILIAGIVFLYLRNQQFRYLHLLQISIPIGLLVTLVEVLLNPGSHWGNRFATYFVDPNTLGSQTFILALIMFLSIASGQGESRWLLLLKLIGGTAGIYVSIYSGSRGAWLTGPFIFLLFLLIQLGDIYRAQGNERFIIALQTSLVIITSIILFCLAFYFLDVVYSRVSLAYHQICNWFEGENLDSPIGTRLDIWKFSFLFASESLLFGYGEEKNMMQLLSNSPLNIPANQFAINTMALAGPHSDILSKLLSSGLFGLFAYLCLLFVPFFFFYTHRNSLLEDKKRAARMGMYYITGIFIAGLSNEQLSLKYLCTFYGLMTATLLAQVLQASKRCADQPFAYSGTKENKASVHG